MELEPTQFFAEPKNERVFESNSGIEKTIASATGTAFDNDNNTILIGGDGGSANSGKLSAYEVIEGGFQRIWTYSTNLTNDVESVIYAGDDEIIAADDEGNIVKVNALDGTEHWNFSGEGTNTRGGIGYNATHVTYSTDIDGSSGDGRTYMLDRSDGTEVWSTLISDGRGAAHMSITNSGDVFQVDIVDDTEGNNNVFYLDGDTGDIMWESMITTSSNNRLEGGVYMPEEDIGIVMSGDEGSLWKFDLTETSSFNDALIGEVSIPSGTTGGGGQTQLQVSESEYVVHSGSTIRIYNLNDEIVATSSGRSPDSWTSSEFVAENNRLYSNGTSIPVEFFIPDRRMSVHFESDDGMLLNGVEVGSGEHLSIDGLKLNESDTIMGLGDWMIVGVYLDHPEQ